MPGRGIRREGDALRYAADLQQQLSIQRVELEVRTQELQRAQVDAERAQLAYSEVFDSGPAAYLTLDEHGRISQASGAAGELLALNARRLIGLPFGSFIAESSWGTLSEHLDGVRQTGRASCELWLKRWDNSVCCARLEATSQRQRAGECLILLTDMSDRLHQRQALEALETKLKELAPLQGFGLMAAGIAHDFNGLLAGLMISADEVLDAPELPDALREPLSIIARSASDAAELTRHLLTPVQPEKCEGLSVDLARVVPSCIELLRNRAGESVDIRTQIGADLPLIAGDRLQVQRVVLNILGNAIEAVGERGVIAVQANLETLDEQALADFQHASTARPGAFVVLRIMDTGPGIAADKLGRIFEPFVTTKAAGRGLGLRIVLEIVGAYEGALRCCSQPGRGTRFDIAFPLATIAARNSTIRPKPARTPGTSLLLIDDDRLVAAAMARALSRLEFEITTSEGGEHGLETFMAAEHLYDVVILDWLMPEMHGAKVFAELRRARPKLPIVLMSGFGAECLPRENEFTARVPKPVSLDKLQSAIRRVSAGLTRSEPAAGHERRRNSARLD